MYQLPNATLKILKLFAQGQYTQALSYKITFARAQYARQKAAAIKGRAFVKEARPLKGLFVRTPLYIDAFRANRDDG